MYLFTINCIISHNQKRSIIMDTWRISHYNTSAFESFTDSIHYSYSLKEHTLRILSTENPFR